MLHHNIIYYDLPNKLTLCTCHGLTPELGLHVLACYYRTFELSHVLCYFEHFDPSDKGQNQAKIS